MTRVDFYLVESADPHSRRVTACRLIEKAWRQGHKVYLQTASEAETGLMDNLLWTFRQGSFVPHEVYAGQGEAGETPIWLGHGAAPEFMADVLVNLGTDLPAGFERFGRLAEIVDQDEAVKRAGRVRYRGYQGQGCEVLTHELKNDERG